MKRDEFPVAITTDYQFARRNIEDGDLLLCSGEGPFSKLIQKFTKSIWSHVGFVLWRRDLDRLVVIESMESKGVREVSLSSYLKYKGQVVISRSGEVSEIMRGHPEMLIELGRFVVDHLGYPYDNDEIARIAWRVVSRKKKGNRKRDKEYICSEFADECFRSIGVEFLGDPRGFITPGDFAIATDLRYVLK